jgi:S-DNA-T family DNA segregation ATPase FtsK/SpoIIIE
MSDSANDKRLEKLEAEVVDLKIRLARVESFIRDIPDSEDYLSSEMTLDNEELIQKAIDLVKEVDGASASLFQRRFSIGYARAARLIDHLEDRGIIGPADGSIPRKVLKPK